MSHRFETVKYANATQAKERGQDPGPPVNFKDTRRIFIERILGKRRPKDPKRNAFIGELRCATIGPHESYKSLYEQ